MDLQNPLFSSNSPAHSSRSAASFSCFSCESLPTCPSCPTNGSLLSGYTGTRRFSLRLHGTVFYWRGVGARTPAAAASNASPPPSSGRQILLRTPARSSPLGLGGDFQVDEFGLFSIGVLSCSPRVSPVHSVRKGQTRTLKEGKFGARSVTPPDQSHGLPAGPATPAIVRSPYDGDLALTPNRVGRAFGAEPG